MNNPNEQPTQYRRDVLVLASRYYRRTINQKDAMQVVKRVARESGVALREVMSDCRRGPVAETRTAAIRAVAAAYPGASSITIGKLFNRDHTTILHALGRLNRRKREIGDKSAPMLQDIAA